LWLATFLPNFVERNPTLSFQAVQHLRHINAIKFKVPRRCRVEFTTFSGRLLKLLDQLDPWIKKLDEAVIQAARSRPPAVCLMQQAGVGR
jgi:hypothetical protein